jgi:hypothetical protein
MAEIRAFMSANPEGLPPAEPVKALAAEGTAFVATAPIGDQADEIRSALKDRSTVVVDRLQPEADDAVVTSTAAAPAPRRGRKRQRIPAASALELGDLSLVEAVQTAIAEDPEDLIRAVGRTHYDLWRRCIDLGRVLEQRPALVLYRALALGLDVIVDDMAEERADG